MTSPDFQKFAVSGDCWELVNEVLLAACPVKKRFFDHVACVPVLYHGVLSPGDC